MTEEDVQAAVDYLRYCESKSERIQEYLEDYDNDERLAADIRSLVPKRELPAVASTDEVTSGEEHTTFHLNWRRIVIAALKVACLCMVLRRAAKGAGQIDRTTILDKLREAYPEVMVLGFEIVNELVEAFA